MLGRKILVFGIVGVLVGGLIYWLFSRKEELSKSSLNVSLMMLEAPKDSVQQQEIVESIMQKIGKKPVDVSINTFLIERNAWSPVAIVKKPSGMERQGAWEQNLRKEVVGIFKKHTAKSLQPEKVNAYLEAFAQKIAEQKKDENSLFVVAGAFPECYNATLAQEGVKKMQTRLGKNFSSENTQILWKVTDTREAEENVLKGLKVNFKENVDDRRVVIPTRNCGEGYPVDVLAFSNLDSTQAREVTDKIIANVSLPISLTLVTSNSSLKNRYSSQKQADSAIYATLVYAEQSEWKTAKFMFQQAFNKYAGMPDSVKANVYLVGKMPDGKEKLFEISKLKNRNNPHFFTRVGAYNSPINFQEVILRSFKVENLQVSAF